MAGERARATIKDVARIAGVSVSTVSYVVNNKLHRVSEKTRKRVLDVIEKVNYVPSRSARGLVSNRTNNIGVLIVNDGKSTRIPAYNDLSDVLSGIGTVLSQKGFSMSMWFSTYSNICTDLFDRGKLDLGNVDGLMIVRPPVHDEFLKSVFSLNLPFVIVNREFDDPRVYFVTSDFVLGAFHATEHLIKNGHERILYFGGNKKGYPVDTARLLGYKKALLINGLSPRDDHVVYCDAAEEDSIRKSITPFFRVNGDIPTAIVAFNDAFAVSALKIVKELGYCVPNDVSIVGFDDSVLAEHSEPPLTSVRAESYRIGCIATDMIIDLVNQKKPLQQKVILQAELVVRQTSDYKRR